MGKINHWSKISENLTEKIEQIKTVLKKWGWKEDRWNNWQKEVEGKKYRYVFKEKVLRKELYIEAEKDFSARWVMTKSNYYGEIVITPEGKLARV